METNPIVSDEQSELQAEPEDQGAEQLQQSPSPTLVSMFLATDSSGSTESCGTYITCKMSQLEEAAAKDFAEVTEAAQRESISDAMEVTVNPEQSSSGQIQSSCRPQVIFLDPLDSQTHGSQAGLVGPSSKRSRSSLSESGSSVGTEPALKDLVAPTSGQTGVPSSNRPLPPPPLFGDQSGSEVDRVSDSDSGPNAGSTLADALKTVHDCSLPVCSDQSSVATPFDPPREPRDVPLGG